MLSAATLGALGGLITVGGPLAPVSAYQYFSTILAPCPAPTARIWRFQRPRSSRHHRLAGPPRSPPRRSAVLAGSAVTAGRSAPAGRLRAIAPTEYDTTFADDERHLMGAHRRVELLD
ncbi:hypothetical protein ACFO5K_19750 [Nocardia halotolerans]|uniref:Uncharacterized protein n=1 Tax=Nocardia halotolerans TaxID=1755878 RepID=A0ABV8VJT0_9NOCA